MPAEPLISKPCKGCGRPIFWVYSMNGKPTPVEKPSPPEYRLEDIKGQWTMVPVSKFISHWATCPAREQFREPKAETPPAAKQEAFPL